jgi:hypothetical protein
MLLFEKLPSPAWFFSPSQVRWGTERGNGARERREGTTRGNGARERREGTTQGRSLRGFAHGGEEDDVADRFLVGE